MSTAVREATSQAASISKPANLIAAQRVAVLVVTALVSLNAFFVLRAFGFRYTDDDGTLYWYAAQEFAHLHFREPFFYGQTYNTLLESLLAAPLVRVSVSPSIALPAVSTVLGLAPWALLALVAWRRGGRAVALGILAGPLLLPPSYWMLLGDDFNAGIAAAMLGICVFLLVPARWSAFVAGLLLALGLALNPNSALLVGAALTYVAFAHARERVLLALVAAGLVLGGALHELGLLFYATHPGWVLHPDWPLSWHRSLFFDGLEHLDRHLGGFAPWAAPWAVLDFAAIAAVGLWAALHRQYALAAAAAVALVATVLSLGVNKVHDGESGIFFSYQRMYLAVPLLIAFLVALAPRVDWKRSALGSGAVAVVALGAFAYQQAALAPAVATATAFPAGAVTSPRSVDSLERKCALDSQVAQSSGATLIVYLQDRGAAYGCGALMYGRVETLFPSYERRTWLLQAEARARRDELVLADVSRSFCAAVDAGLASCQQPPKAPQVAVLSTRAQPALTVLRQLKVAVRAF